MHDKKNAKLLDANHQDARCVHSSTDDITEMREARWQSPVTDVTFGRDIAPTLPNVPRYHANILPSRFHGIFAECSSHNLVVASGPL